HNLEPHQRLLAKLKALMGRLGCHDTPIPAWSILDKRIPLAGVAHQSGTVRFGDDPKTSALNINCRAHHVDNLYVVDTRFFPSLTSSPPPGGGGRPARTGRATPRRVGAPRRQLPGAHKTAATQPASDGRRQEVPS